MTATQREKLQAEIVAVIADRAPVGFGVIAKHVGLQDKPLVLRALLQHLRESGQITWRWEGWHVQEVVQIEVLC